MTPRIRTLKVITPRIMTRRIMALRIMTIKIMTFRIMTPGKMALNMKLRLMALKGKALSKVDLLIKPVL